MFDTALSQEEDIRLPGPAIDDQAENAGSLLREAHHRMKNTLTLLSAWLRADFKSTASVDLPKAIDGFERRIVAFGRRYDLLSPQDVAYLETVFAPDAVAGERYSAIETARAGT
jgi:two-component sensor histidine kinase